MAVKYATEQIVVPIADSSQVGEVRRIATRLGREVGLRDADRGRLAIIVTEAATNIIKHANKGEILLRACGLKASGVEVLALDKGPGIKDVNRSLRDGYSTSGTAGNGLGAIIRLANAFDIYSSEAGVAVMARIISEGAPSPTKRVESGAICIAKTGESSCGDAWALLEQTDRTLVLVVDGLGHGRLAADAAQEARRIFLETESLSLEDLLDRVHGALRRMRGAVAAVLAVSADGSELRFAGVGNISGTIVHADGQRTMISHNGTLGSGATKIQEYSYPLPKRALLIMSSDGLQTQWQLGRYPGLAPHDPCLIASILYRDFNRELDDVTVVVLRQWNSLV